MILKSRSFISLYYTCKESFVCLQQLDSEGFSLFHQNDVIPIAWLWLQWLLTDYIAYLFNR